MKKIISLLITVSILSFIFNISFAFSDTSSHWAKSDIETLVSKGVIGGYNDGSFKPDKKITRAEFTKILLISLGNDPGGSSTSHWASNYIEEAENKKYIGKGYFNNGIDEKITRGEMAMMIINASNEASPTNTLEYSRQIEDYNNTPEIFKSFILKAYVLGIITGYTDNKFRYNYTATRAEAVTMLVRLIDKTKRKVPVLATPSPIPSPTPSPKQKADFIEPDIKVILNEEPCMPEYFKIKIDNFMEYDDNYQFRINIKNYNQLNVKDIYTGGNWYHIIVNQWNSYKYLRGYAGEIYTLLNAYYTTRNSSFKVTPGMVIDFEISIKKGNTVKTYPISATVPDIDFAD